MFITLDLFPGGETVWEGPAINSKADTVKDRKAGVFWTPESGKKRVRVAEWGGRRSQHWCSNVRGWKKVSSWGERRVRCIGGSGACCGSFCYV